MANSRAGARLPFLVDPAPQSESALEEMVRSYATGLALLQFYAAHPHYCPLDSDMTDRETAWFEARRDQLLRDGGRAVAAFLRAIPRPRWDEADPIARDLYDHYQRCVATLFNGGDR